jgi:hypothetical protein
MEAFMKITATDTARGGKVLLTKSKPRRRSVWSIGRFALGVTGALWLSACAGYDPDALQESGWYLQGYNDGCATAGEADKSFSNKQVKDQALFDSDKGYRAGWRQGLLQCRKQDPQSDGQTLGRGGEF